jgi:Flp pilus assembly pilin Flp
MHRLIDPVRCDEKGAARVEYGVICAAAMTVPGQKVSTGFSIIAAELSAI